MSFCIAWHKGYSRVEDNLSLNKERLEKNSEKLRQNSLEKINLGCSHNHGHEIVYLYSSLFSADVEEDKKYKRRLDALGDYTLDPSEPDATQLRKKAK